MNIENLQAYHKHITDTYDERSANHDKSEWHRNTALRLIEGFPPRSGDSVLDIGTGTGTIAFHAASLNRVRYLSCWAAHNHRNPLVTRRSTPSCFLAWTSGSYGSPQTS